MRGLDRVAGFSLRHERAIGLVAAAWFVLGCADAAGFIDLPKIPFLTGTAGLIAAALANAAWHGFAKPALENRKKELGATRSPGAPEV